MKLVAVTSCPTGIAHTYMAAEALEIAARDAGHEIHVETQGAAGANPIDPEVLANADAAIFAADVEVRDRGRFAHLPTVTAKVKSAISDAPALITAAVEKAKATPAGSAAVPAAARLATKVESDASVGTRIRQWLMTGVSYMIPFVAAGGILIALGFMFGGDEVVTKLYGGTYHGVTYQDVAGSLPSGINGGIDKLIAQAGYAGLLFAVGKVAFFMLVPILAGFIAFAIADRPGLVPGIVGGLLAGAIGAGFLGGLVAGGAAGAIAYYLARLRVPKGMRGIMPVVVIPLVSTILIGFVMLIVVGKPIAAAETHLTNWLNGLSGSNAILLGVILGLMMAFDMGGPVNKVAYTFGVAALASGDTKIMAAVMAAGMTPPLGLALATVVRRNLFTDAEHENGRAAWLLGASFITEGAIPFAAGDPLRVIPSLMAGSAVTGALSMAFGASLRAPHGGIWVIALIGRPVFFVLSVVVGTVVTTACVVALKSLRRTAPSTVPAHAQQPIAA
jgi:PTS system fructose-specific IIC component